MNIELNIFDTVIATEVAHHDVHEEILTRFHPWLSNIYFKSDNRLIEISKRAISKL